MILKNEFNSHPPVILLLRPNDAPPTEKELDNISRFYKAPIKIVEGPLEELLYPGSRFIRLNTNEETPLLQNYMEISKLTDLTVYEVSRIVDWDHKNKFSVSFHIAEFFNNKPASISTLSIDTMKQMHMKYYHYC